MMRTHRLRSRILPLFGLCAALALLFVVASFAQKVPEASPVGAALHAQVLADIRDLGGAGAYTKFKESVASKQHDRAHNSAHVFGAALYEELGVSGIKICDTELNFGCYHGFLAEAISSEGLSVITSLDNDCAQTPVPTGCAHGIGHGILEYVGYDHLADALDACRNTNQPDPLAGCTTGVFMEYNTPLTENQSGIPVPTARPMDDAMRPYDPCPSVDVRFQQACYNQLPQWWNQVYHHDFAKIGNLCATIPNEHYVTSCVLGIGSIAASSGDYDAQKTIALCQELARPEHASRCLFVAAGSFVHAVHDIESAHLLCTHTLPRDQFLCNKF